MASQVFSASKRINHCAVIMRLPKNFSITALILLAALMVVAGSFPTIASQAFTTVTTTNLVTINTYSTQTIGYTTQTTSSTSVIVDETDSVAGGAGHCWYDSFALNIQPGTVAVTGNIGPSSTTHGINFYIMTNAQFNNFQGSSCIGGQAPEAMVEQGISSTSAYTLNWKSPPPGSYNIVVFSNSPGGNGFTVPITIMVLNTQEETSPVYNVITGEETLPVTQLTTASYSSVPSVLSQAQNWFNFNSLVAYLVFLVAVGAVAIFMIWNHGRPSRRSRTTLLTDYVTSKPAAPRKAKTAAKTESSQQGKAFCVNCGKELPAEWKFCRHCGTKQP